ncbi:MAG: type II toxin-antitoxin system Phd/YefM family antitoxin [Chloroflexota bacterium]|nr:type II toxin-antitoxin system Phd/YefM family antitoxin [Chloroflexota bacterium]
MITTVQSTDLRRKVREVLDTVQMNGKPVIVRTYDAPQAVLIPYDDFKAYQDWQAQQQKRAAWLDELQAIAEEVSTRADIPGQEADDLIAEAVQETRTS